MHDSLRGKPTPVVAWLTDFRRLWLALEDTRPASMMPLPLIPADAKAERPSQRRPAGPLPVGPFGGWLIATPPAGGLLGRVHAAISVDAASGVFRNVTRPEDLSEWLSVVDLRPDEQQAVKSLFASAMRRVPL